MKFYFNEKLKYIGNQNIPTEYIQYSTEDVEIQITTDNPANKSLVMSVIRPDGFKTSQILTSYIGVGEEPGTHVWKATITPYHTAVIPGVDPKGSILISFTLKTIEEGVLISSYNSAISRVTVTRSIEPKEEFISISSEEALNSRMSTLEVSDESQNVLLEDISSYVDNSSTRLNDLEVSDEAQDILLGNINSYVGTSDTRITSLEGIQPTLLKNVTYTPSNGHLTFFKQNGTSFVLDLPLELIIESGYYDEINKNIVLVLANDDEIKIPIGDILTGIATKNYVDTAISNKQTITNIEHNNPLSEVDLIVLMLTLDNDIYRVKTTKNGYEILHIDEMWLPMAGQEPDLEDPVMEQTKQYSRRLANGTSFVWNPGLNDWELAAGGGGGSGTEPGVDPVAQVKLRPYPINASINFQHAVGADLVFRYEYLHSLNSAGVAQYFKNGVLFQTETINTGVHSITLGPRINIGTNTFKIKVLDYENIERNLTVIVEGISITVSSAFNDTAIQDPTFNFPYKVSATGTKKAYFSVDGGEVEEVSITTENNIKSFTLAHGGHMIEFWATTTIEATVLTSEVLRFTALVNDGSGNTILASKFNVTEVTQGSLIVIDYLAYRYSNEITPIMLYIDDVLSGSLSVGRARNFWNIRNISTGEHEFKIVALERNLTFNINIIPLDMDIDSIDDAFLKLYLTANGRSNSDRDRDEWNNSGVNGDNYNFNMTKFNYASNGWINDSLVFNGNAEASLDFKPFTNEVGSSGKTIEIEFMAPITSDGTKTLIECLQNGRGFEIKPNKATFKGNNNRVDVFYKEGERVKLSFVISKTKSIIFSYINGVLAGQDFIISTTRFQQAIPVPIIFNTLHEGLTLYSLRVYDRELDDKEILKNYIYDLSSLDEKIAEYNKSLIFSTAGLVDYEKLKEMIPTMMITLNEDFPQAADNRPYIQKMDYINPWDTSLNFERLNVRMRTQGTSTLQYPVKNYRFEKGGLEAAPVRLVAGSRPAKVLNIKVDYVDSSVSTNVVIAKMINDMYSELLPPQNKDPEFGVRNTIYGNLCAVFHNNNGTITFRGLYNLNNDKSEPAIYGHDPEYGFDESHRFELSFNAGENAVAFVKRPGISEFDWQEEIFQGFESIYPKQEWADGNTTVENYASLKEFIEFIALADISTMDAAAKAAYKAEMSKRLDTEYAIKYFIATSIFGLVDNFGKDLLFNTWGKDSTNEFNRWYLTYYDMDTAVGIDNQGRLEDGEGNLLYDYNIELDDSVSFAQAESKLWDTIIELYGDEIKSAYKTMRTTTFTEEKIMENFFENHIDKVGGALYNATNLYKYVDTVGSSDWYWMLRGDRRFQLKRWITNRLAFLDSKYVAGTDATSKMMSFRLSSPDMTQVSIDVVPNIHQYASIRYGNSAVGLVQERGLAGEVINLQSPLSGTVSFLECSIYGADKLTEVRGLGLLDIETLSFANATSLKRIDLGSLDDNTSLSSLSFANNLLLEEIDIRNMKALTSTLNLSSLINLKKLDATGSNITAVDFSDGGVLEEIHLPASLTSLDLLNQTYLQDDKWSIEDLTNLETIRVENTPISSLALITNAPNLTNVRIMGLEFATNDKQLLLDAAAKLFDMTTESFLMGGINSDGTLSAIPTIYGEARIYANTDYEPFEYDLLWNAFRNLNINVIVPNLSLTFTDMGEHYEVKQYTGPATKLTIPVGLNPELESVDTVTLFTFENFKPVLGIGANAFKNNIVLEEIVLPPKMEYIGNSAFEGVTKLEVIPFSVKLTTIGDYAFKGDQNFDLIYLPKTILNIGIGAFTDNETADGDIIITEHESIPTGWHPQWVDDSYTVVWDNSLSVRTFTFDVGGGSYIMPYEGYVLKTLPTPTKAGHDFVNWTVGGVEVELPFIPVTDDPANITIKANWSIWTYTLKWYDYDNSGNRRVFEDISTPLEYNDYLGDGKLPDAPDNSTLLGVWQGWKNSDETIVDATYQETRDLSANNWVIEIDAYYVLLAEGCIFTYDSGNDVYTVTAWNPPDPYKPDSYYDIFIPATWDDGTNGEHEIRHVTLVCDDTIQRNKLGSIEIEANTLNNRIYKNNTSSTVGQGAHFKYLKTVILPEGFININTYAFQGCSALTSITIPDSVTSIGNYAFLSCTSLTSITIPDSVTSIGVQAFYNCSALTSITIPNSVTSIGNNAFQACSALTSITIPDSVTSIGTSAFNNCSSLTSITIPNSVTSISSNAFYNCTALTSITIPNSVTSIGNNAFQGCSALTSITIPDSVTSIGVQAFYNCSALTSITIPNSVTSIGSNAFQGCTSLISVILLRSIPATLGSGVFNSNKEGRIFYVPVGKLATYQGATGWSSYGNDAFEEVA